MYIGRPGWSVAPPPPHASSQPDYRRRNDEEPSLSGEVCLAECIAADHRWHNEGARGCKVLRSEGWRVFSAGRHSLEARPALKPARFPFALSIQPSAFSAADLCGAAAQMAEAAEYALQNERRKSSRLGREVEQLRQALAEAQDPNRKPESLDTDPSSHPPAGDAVISIRIEHCA